MRRLENGKLILRKMGVTRSNLIEEVLTGEDSEVVVVEVLEVVVIVVDLVLTKIVESRTVPRRLK